MVLYTQDRGHVRPAWTCGGQSKPTLVVEQWRHTTGNKPANIVYYPFEGSTKPQAATYRGLLTPVRANTSGKWGQSTIRLPGELKHSCNIPYT